MLITFYTRDVIRSDCFVLMLEQELKPQEASCYSLDTQHAPTLALFRTHSSSAIDTCPSFRSQFSSRCGARWSSTAVLALCLLLNTQAEEYLPCSQNSAHRPLPAYRDVALAPLFPGHYGLQACPCRFCYIVYNLFCVYVQ